MQYYFNFCFFPPVFILYLLILLSKKIRGFPRKDLGGYSERVPPLTIPNREVKPFSADGTWVTPGRVGRRHFIRAQHLIMLGSYHLYPSHPR